MITNQGSVLVTGERDITTSVDGAPVDPFSGVTLTDPTPGATDTVSILIGTPYGTLTDGPGYSGLTKTFYGFPGAPVDDYRYTLPTGSAAQVTSELDALVFTPSAYSDSVHPSIELLLNASSSQPNNALVTGGGDPTTSTETQVRVIPARSISIDPGVTYDGGGTFTLTGTAQSVAGVTGVEITAAVNGTTTDLGPATLNADGTFAFTDQVGANVQGFITATATDGSGAQSSAVAAFSLQAGLSGAFTARQTSYTADGSAETAVTAFREGGSRRVSVEASGQTFTSHSFDTFLDGGRPNNTFVFDPGFGRDVVSLFRVDGTDHDSLSFKASDYGNSVATVLNSSRDTAGGLLITDPVASSPGGGPGTHDTLLLKGITKDQLTANQGDVTFHA